MRKPQLPPHQPLRDMPKTVLSTRARNCLLNIGFTTVGDLLAMSDERLLAELSTMPNGAAVTCSEILRVFRPSLLQSTEAADAKITELRARIAAIRKRHLAELEKEVRPVLDQIEKLERQKFPRKRPQKFDPSEMIRASYQARVAPAKSP